MDQQDLKRELEQIHVLTKDNHRMLRAIRRDQMYALIAKIVFWAVIIGVPIYFYQAVFKPQFDEFKQNPTGAALNVFGLPSSAEIQKLIDSFKSGTN